MSRGQYSPYSEEIPNASCHMPLLGGRSDNEINPLDLHARVGQFQRDVAILRLHRSRPGRYGEEDAKTWTPS